MVSKALGEQNLILAGRTLNPRLHPPPVDFQAESPILFGGTFTLRIQPYPPHLPCTPLKGDPPLDFQAANPTQFGGTFTLRVPSPPLEFATGIHNQRSHFAPASRPHFLHFQAAVKLCPVNKTDLGQLVTGLLSQTHLSQPETRPQSQRPYSVTRKSHFSNLASGMQTQSAMRAKSSLIAAKGRTFSWTRPVVTHKSSLIPGSRNLTID